MKNTFFDQSESDGLKGEDMKGEWRNGEYIDICGGIPFHVDTQNLIG